MKIAKEWLNDLYNRDEDYKDYMKGVKNSLGSNKEEREAIDASMTDADKQFEQDALADDEYDRVMEMMAQPEVVSLFETMFEYDNLGQGLTEVDGKLFNAVEHYKEEDVRAAIEEGADVNCRGKNGVTPLMVIASGLDVEVTPELILAMRKSEDISHFGHDIEIAKASMLLDAGADLTIKDAKGRTALDIIKARGRNDLLKDLFDAHLEKIKLEGSVGQATSTSATKKM
ncbi:MAG TPA: ankyrin repeat domain-containing protein [Anaerovoracaceae bacterium]|nr:ankyrin repeat domain-containing protein [Anaerovoracaceae bacterium]